MMTEYCFTGDGGVLFFTDSFLRKLLTPSFLRGYELHIAVNHLELHIFCSLFSFVQQLVKKIYFSSTLSRKIKLFQI